MVKENLLILILAILVSSCSTIEILDGLCFNDKEGTYLCPEEETPVEFELWEINPEMKDYREHEDRWNTCEPFIDMDGEAWMNCMLIA